MSSEKIAERRLRHVYDNLDAGLNKKAAAEAEKVLKKHPDALGAKALKSLALLRLGREAEAWTLIDDVVAAIPTQHHILSALEHCFKDAGRSERVAEIYAQASKAEPKNEELLSQLALAHLRQRDFKAQQQASIQLSRLKPASREYVLWTASALLLQGDADPPLGQKMFYPMAEKLVVKLGPARKDSELCLHLLVLERQEKWSAGLELLESEAAKALWDRRYRRLQLLARLRRWEEVISEAAEAVESAPDDWRLYEFLLEAVVGSVEDEGGKWEEEGSVLERVSSLILRLVWAESGKTRPQRGPYLARLALIQRLLEREIIPRAQLGEPLTLLLEFVRVFGAKPSCFVDVEPFLGLLGEQQRGEFLSGVWAEAGMELEAEGLRVKRLPQSLPEMWRHLCCFNLSSALGRLQGLSGAERVEVATQLVRLYQQGLRLQPDIRSSEIRVGDAYLVLASQIVWALYLEQADTSLLLGLMVELEAALVLSPVNFNLKLCLAKLYSAVGASKLLLRLAESLDLKYVQLESLCYLMVDQLVPYGSVEELRRWLGRWERWWRGSEREMGDCLATAYKANQLSRVPEMASFHRRLAASANRRCSVVAQAYFSALVSIESAQDLGNVNLQPLRSEPGEPISLVDLTDNRDLSVLPPLFTPTSKSAIESHKERSLGESLDVCRLRDVILRFVAVCGLEKVEGEEGRAKRLRSLLSQLRAHVRHCRANYEEAEKPPLEGVMPTHFHLLLSGSYLPFLDGVLDSLARMAEASDGNEKGAEREGNMEERVDISELFRAMVAGHQVGSSMGASSPVPSPHFPFLQLVHLSFAAHITATAALAFTAALHFLPQGSSQRKKKAKDLDGERSELESLSESLLETLTQAPGVLERLLGDLCVINQADPATLNVNTAPFFLRPVDEEALEVLAQVRKELRGSYASSLEALTAFLAHIRRLVENLRKGISSAAL